MIINTTILAWKDIRKLEGLEGQLSSLSPVWGNIDFCPGSKARGFKLWQSKGIFTIGHLCEKNAMLSFSQLCKKYNLPQNDFLGFFRYRVFLTVKKNQGSLVNSPH